MVADKKDRLLENAFEIFDKSTGKKIVYIMADKKCERYAHTLQTLISAKHDLKCSIYTKQVYKAHMSKVSSDNLIVFIGENDISNAALPKVKNQADGNFGLVYGWHGKRAIISTESIFVNQQSLKDFVEYYNNLCEGMQKQITQFGACNDLLTYFSIIGGGIMGLGGLGIIPIVTSSFVLSFGFVGIKNKNTFKNFKIKKDLQYRACIMEFYNNGLDKFIEDACRE